MEYFYYFFLTLFLSTFFALGGVGSAIAIVPIFNFLGIPLNAAKATGLFINTSTTLTATYLNFKKGVLDIKFALPIALTMMIASPIGAFASTWVSEIVVKWILLFFLLTSASFIFFSKKPLFQAQSSSLLLVLSFFVGLLSGVLGVGGGSLIMPVLLILGYETKRVAVAMSFVVPFSTFFAFLTYLSFTELDYILLVTVTIAAVVGGIIGNRLMHLKLNNGQIKKIIAVILYLLAFRLLVSLLTR